MDLRSTRIKPKTTAAIVQALAAALEASLEDESQTLPFSADIAIGHAIARLVELEPNNPDLDDWREHIRHCNWHAGCPTGK